MERVSLADFSPLPEKEQQYPLEFIKARNAIKLAEDEDCVKVGISKADDLPLIEELVHYLHEKKLRFYQIDQNELAIYIGRFLSEEGQSSSLNSAEDEKLQLDKLANDAPIVALVNTAFLEAIERGASDIHIETQPKCVRFRLRMDGQLYTIREVPLQRFAAISSRIKLMANLNIMERRQPQDGRISVELGGEDLDLRVSIVPTQNGESIVLRIFNREEKARDLSALGFSKDSRRLIESFGEFAYGLILISGPTGSGKTTTLSALLKQIRSDDKKIITIEDPVENVMEGLNQIQTHEKIDLTFNNILRRVLRQDPDIIMVGEIRDGTTAELCLKAAMTGHLVLSTLHTNDSISIINRLINMGLPAYLISSVLRGALSQRLLRLLCPQCKEQRPSTPADAAFLKKAGRSDIKAYYAVGCPACFQTGYKGRTALAEGFLVDLELEEKIASGNSKAELKKHLEKRAGYRDLLQTALGRLESGDISLEEIRRVVL